jgi:hypothetical protein
MISQISGSLIGPLAAANTNKEVVTSHVNLIWSPVAFIDAGIEYMWGQRKTLAGIYGKQQVLISKFAFKF